MLTCSLGSNTHSSQFSLPFSLEECQTFFWFWFLGALLMTTPDSACPFLAPFLCFDCWWFPFIICLITVQVMSYFLMAVCNQSSSLGLSPDLLTWRANYLHFIMAWSCSFLVNYLPTSILFPLFFKILPISVASVSLIFLLNYYLLQKESLNPFIVLMSLDNKWLSSLSLLERIEFWNSEFCDILCTFKELLVIADPFLNG